jgi:hypothetical protein
VDSETLLLRQINPGFVQLGRPTSQAFRPTPKDEYLLSVEDGSRISPRASWERFNKAPDCNSVGVMGVSFAECTEQELPVIEDGDPFPEHCSIDFSNLTKGLIEKKAKFLAKYAVERDWLCRAS